VDGSTGRDGLDLVNTRDVLIEDSRIEGSDDALCFKTIKNSGLHAYPSYRVTVRRSEIASTWCNAIQFGSATELSMSDFAFSDLTIHTARKAAIGVISMDGANVARLSFTNIAISGNVATPIYVKLGNRVDCEDGKGGCWEVGSIADVNFTNVSAVGWGNVSNPKPGHRRGYTATLEGLNASHRIGPIRLSGVTLLSPGGGVASDSRVDPPVSPLDYQPRYDGIRPSYGLFARYAHGLDIENTSIGVKQGEEDARPAMVMDAVDAVRLLRLNVDDAACQLEVRNVSGSIPPEVHSCAWSPIKAAAEHASSYY